MKTLINDLNLGEVTLIASRPSVGKTSLALNLQLCIDAGNDENMALAVRRFREIAKRLKLRIVVLSQLKMGVKDRSHNSRMWLEWNHMPTMFGC